MEKQKNFLEDISSGKPESFKEEVFIPARRGPGRIIAVVAVILSVLAVFFILQQIGKVTVPAMSDWQLSEVQDWVSKYHENTVMNGIYTMETPLNGIISQDIEAGKKIDKSTAFTVAYSLGADPEEAVAVPDLKNMPLNEVKNWIDDNQMTGVTIQYENSEIIPKDSVISLEFVEGSQEEFLRKNRMIIYVSSGAQDMDETIEMPDLYGKTRAELIQWSEENRIEVHIKEEFNDYVDYGKVFEQSILENTKITHNDKVTVTISRGKAIEVPDFTGMSRSEASDLAALYGINIFYKLVISTQDADTVLSQDVGAGTEVDGQQIVTLEIAKEDGKSIVPDFVGLSRNEAESLAALYNIKMFINNSDEFGTNGIVATQSISHGKEIEEGQVITVNLKKSDNITVPDFTGMTKNEATIAAQELGIQLLFNEVETAKTKNQLVISQSVKAKAKVEPEDTILLDIAVNSGIAAEEIWSMDLHEAQSWAARKGINLNVVDRFSSDYQNGELYYQDTDAGDYIPSNKVLTVYRSLGLVMADSFIGKTKSDIIKWRDEVNSKGAEIRLQFHDDTDTPKAKGTVTNQSIYGDLVELDRTIQVWVAASDDGVRMKDFTSLPLDNFKLWCDTNNVPYIVSDCYSETAAAGTMFGQNYTDTYLPKGEYLRINNSLGRLYIKDFRNETKASMIDWMRDVNSKMANIKITFVADYSNVVEKGRIIDQSIKDTEISLDETITVTYSLGMPY